MSLEFSKTQSLSSILRFSRVVIRFSFFIQAENGDASEKSTSPAAENSKEVSTPAAPPPPEDPGECGSDAPPIAAVEGASSAKTEAASTHAQIVEGESFFFG